MVLENCVRIESSCAVEIYSPDTLGVFTAISPGITQLEYTRTRTRAQRDLPPLTSATLDFRLVEPNAHRRPFYATDHLYLPPSPFLPTLHPHRQSLHNGKDRHPRRAVHVQTAPTARLATHAVARIERCVGMIVSTTERKAGAHVTSAVTASVIACEPGGLLVVDMRPCVVVGDAYALAELNVFAVEVEVVESPSMGPGARLSRVRFF